MRIARTRKRTTRIVAFGQAGDDSIQVSEGVSLSAWLFGEEGNDVLRGISGENVLVGGDGDDRLMGRQGRDLLIGGLGQDMLMGNGDDDLLIAGFTVFDARFIALNAIMAEWTSSRDYVARVANLSGASSGKQLNGNFFFKVDGASVFDDGVEDRLSGGAGRDWLLANVDSGELDEVLGLMFDEVLDDLD